MPGAGPDRFAKLTADRLKAPFQDFKRPWLWLGDVWIHRKRSQSAAALGYANKTQVRTLLLDEAAGAPLKALCTPNPSSLY